MLPISGEKTSLLTERPISTHNHPNVNILNGNFLKGFKVLLLIFVLIGCKKRCNVLNCRTGLVPSDREGARGVREADLRARQRSLDFFLLLQRVVVSSEQELAQLRHILKASYIDFMDVPIHE